MNEKVLKSLEISIDITNDTLSIWAPEHVAVVTRTSTDETGCGVIFKPRKRGVI
ncbi:hypothetical protein KIV66_gp57 [Mycobacterium phage MyraDee]|uniref:Uncharacterized protein n=1 Tax=Mycobacterium phage MyraDee TaxID=2024303 RepID=A0A222YZB1_9CAUD|nr:hypothetical protein KIV66_gp57 [Mycobacterium phage MyraDee]ASR77164.1 hypothetical protein SEA_MYRADEE_57 [Mycobacterium phage MyraDee]